MNPFDEKIRQSLEGFEMPYDSAAWTALESQLPKAGTGSSSGISWKGIAAIAVVAVGIVGALVLTNNDDAEMIPGVVTEIENVNRSDNKAEIKTQEQSAVSIDTHQKKAETSSESVVRTSDRTVTKPSIKNPLDSRSEMNMEETNSSTVQSEHPSETVDRSTNSSAESTAPIAPFRAGFIVSSTSVCAGEDVAFINESSDKTATMSWQFGDGELSNEVNPVHNFILPGNYQVTLSGNKDGVSDEQIVIIKVNPVPMPMLTAERIYDGIPLYRFATAVQPNETATWAFTDGGVSNGNAVERLFRSEGRSTVKLSLKNNYGCVTSVDETYELNKFNLLAPNTFTPNNDGNNDTFIPVALGTINKSFRMTILNPRTGEVVYETSNANDGWNGNLHNNGQKLEVGVYVWTVVIKENIVKNKVFNGKINLKHQ